ncbi:hypothetical protein E0H80_16465 [Acinetobacter sp. ANC 4779]|uniref:helix-turn-helix domain-containing protein n=1 Tax=Acinetobacter sp. ANC 4779 TaxID=2529848 RepID=UPI00103C1B04|nr:helix-turn-helix domain-containing protein [Acinetobacter sp. ANC 4779]TCB47014.1 hypothetical protein E0H80_16465 [Acinetobacter sp. ANC 4779]
MGIKNKITGVMVDLIVERKQDRTFNYTYQDIQKELLEKFDTSVSINSIRLRYLKATQNAPIRPVAVQTSIKPKIAPEAVKKPLSKPCAFDGLRAKKLTEEEINALNEELKGF